VVSRRIAFGLVVGGALALLAQSATAQNAAPNGLLIRAGKAWVAPGQALVRASLLVKNGKIVDAVARPTNDAKETFLDQADSVRDFGKNAVLTAGFVDVHTHAGSDGELAEPVESFTPELRASRAYDAWASAWKRITARGVTSAVLAPDDRNLAGGIAAFVDPGLAAGSDADNYFKMSLTGAALNRERRPTSLMGAADYLRERATELQNLAPAKMTPAQRALAAVIGGGQSVGIACSTVREIHAALDATTTYQLRTFLIHADEAEECLARIVGAKVPVVLRPLGLQSSRKQLRLPGVLQKAGVAFAFAGENDQDSGLPGLQTSLAIAVRQGITAADALASVTTRPAQIAGQSKRVGTLFTGRDADILVWSGEPWDLRSRLLAVIRNGTILHENKQ
jgi:imidazolonepropionase-like amidohydrolase